MDPNEKNDVVERLDFYGDLLTDKQRAYLENYLEEDFSLTEIAEQESVSRQAISENINRSLKTLADYENKLHLVQEFKQRVNLEEKLLDYIQTKYPDDKQLMTFINQLQMREN